MSEANKEIIKRAFEAINKHDASALLSQLHPNLHKTHEGALHAAKAGFPNMQLQIEDMIAEGDKVVTRWTMHGTHTGEVSHTVLGAVKPTNRDIRVTGITIHQIQNGKVVNTWGETSELHGLQQLGLMQHYATAMASHQPPHTPLHHPSPQPPNRH